MKHHILIIEDTYSIANSYREWLKSAGISADIANSAETALNMLADQHFDAIVLDLNLPGMSGKALLESGQLPPSCPVIMATSFGSIKTALEATRAGAVDFLVKPFTKAALVSALHHVMKQAAKTLADIPPKRTAAPTPIDSDALSAIIGECDTIMHIKNLIPRYARSSAPVFIMGETGTGKELCAEALHKLSRKDQPLVSINCAAIPKDLLESELFGHVKGAFSGAINDRAGAVKSAHKGTLFLDEICEMDMALQSKLLRYLESGKTRPLGADHEESYDVRIICATNRNPNHAVAKGEFRQDLYYRLMVLPITMPPLNQRSDDIVLIAQSLLAKFATMEGIAQPPILTEDAQATLKHHHWPGNIRELANILRRATLLAETAKITLNDIAPLLESAVMDPDDPLARLVMDQSFHEIERQILEKIIDQCGGNLAQAAKKLRLSPSTLYRKRELWQETDAAS